METVYRNNYPYEVNPAATENAFLASLMRVIWFLAYLLEGFLALRFILEALGANAGASFTNFIYRLTNPFVVPFRGIVASSISGRSVIDWTAIIAMIVYWLVAWAIVKLLSLAWSDPTYRTAVGPETIVEDNSPAYFEDEPTIIRETPSYTDYRVRKQRRI